MYICKIMSIHKYIKDLVKVNLYFSIFVCCKSIIYLYLVMFIFHIASCLL